MQNIKKLANFTKSKHDHVLEFVCRLKQINESEQPLDITISRDCCGQWLLDEACDRLGLLQEKDYFGLRYTDKDKQRQWLDLGKNIYAQLKDINPVVSFRIKHYPATPLEDFKQTMACSFLYLQLRRDLYSGRLLGKSSDLYQLAAFAAQCECGDYDIQNEDLTYISNLKLLQNLHTKTEGKIADIHKTLAGMTKEDAERKFLEKACELDTYGVEPFYVKDQKGNNLYVGLTHDGVSTFQGSRRAHLFKWNDISKIHYQGKLFIIQVQLEEVDNNGQYVKKHVLGFKCETTFAAAALWKWANDRMCFFSLNRSSEAKKVKSGGGIFRKRQTFRFAGRCQHEILQSSASMMQICESSTLESRHSSTLQRGDAVTDDYYGGGKPKFDTLPSRDRGTRETLESLFDDKNPISVHGDGSPVISSLGSPKYDRKSITQSLEHIIEEPLLANQDIMVENKVGSTLANPKMGISQTSSSKSSSNNLISIGGDNPTKRKLSATNGDIAVALAQLNLAVSDAVSHEITKVVKRNNIGRCVLRCVCVSCVLISFLLLLSFVALFLVTLITVHNHDEGGSYDYSAVFYHTVALPREFVRTSRLSDIVRHGYLHLSKYFYSH